MYRNKRLFVTVCGGEFAMIINPISDNLRIGKYIEIAMVLYVYTLVVR